MDTLLSVLPSQDKAVVSSQQLKEACRLLTSAVEENKEKYECMLRDNKHSLKAYNVQSKLLYQKWERCREQLDSFKEEQMFARQLDGMLAVSTSLQADQFEDYQMRVMVEWCVEAALSDDLCMISFTHDGREYMIRSVFLNLVTALQSVKPSMAIGRLYCVLHINAHHARLESLPQAAGLFLSESRLLSVLLNAPDIERCAACFLQLHVNTIMGELQELREHGGAVHLDSGNFEHIMRRPFKQIQLQLERLSQTTSFMHADTNEQWLRDVQQRMCILLTRNLCDTFWHILVNTNGGIAKDCIVDLKQLAESILSIYDINHVKLKVIVQLCDYSSLLQWTSAYRKGAFKRVLSNEELACLVKIYYAESSMRTAFLKELLVVEDYSDEE